MVTAWRITDSVSDNAVNFGRLNAPTATPSDVLVKYDFAGKHLENISTFPDRSRLVPAQYDHNMGGWKLDDLYASDVKITNQFLIRKGIDKEIPLYYCYTTTLPLYASQAMYNGITIQNESSLYSEYSITDRLNTNMMQIYLHNAVFIPYSEHLGVSLADSNKNLFYVKIYSNGSKDLEVHKIRFKAIDTNDVSLNIIPDHYEYLSVERIFEVFNLNYELKDGMGADLLAYSYSGSTKNPLMYMDSTTLLSPVNDPDANLGRPDNEYTLIYNYQSKTYTGVLSDSLKRNTKFMNKPIPWLSVYFDGVATIDSSNITITRSASGSLVLTLIEPGSSARGWTYSITGRSSTNVAADINNSGAPFSAYALLRIPAISQDTLWINSATRYTDILADAIPTDSTQQFDSTPDGGLLLRSSYFFSRYTSEPTLYSIAPSDHSSPVLSWYPKVKFGGYVADNGNAYYVNEYATQGWSPRYGFPYRDISGENVFMLDVQTIQCKHYPIKNDENHLILTGSTGANINDQIDGIDSLRGLIFLKRPFTVTSGINELFLSYAYEERFVEALTDVNPLPGHTGKVGKYYSVCVSPYISPDRQVNSRTITVEVTDSLPTKLYTDTGKLILAVYLITDRYTVDQYSIDLPYATGGGLRRDIPLDVLNRKVPDLHSFTDVGYYDGLRFPANCVLLVDLPNYVRQGTVSVLVEPYDNTAVTNNTLKVYGAAHIKPGTNLRIYSGLVGTGSYETAVVVAPIDHTTLKIETELSMRYNIGAPIVLDTSKGSQFTTEEVDQAVTKFMTIGTQPFITYK